MILMFKNKIRIRIRIGKNKNEKFIYKLLKKNEI